MSKTDSHTPSHQTVQLAKGRHSGPEDGVCVMELASMLAGERFSDHPAAVCPVIAAFLRTYNDLVEDDRRQELYAYASLAIGTRDRRARRRRVALCRSFIEAAHQPPGTPGRDHRRALGRWGAESAGSLAARTALASASPTRHSMALALLDALLVPDPSVPGDASSSVAEPELVA
jgi:hypothetical protein